MENLTAQQLFELAKNLKMVAKAINDYQIQNWNNLSTEQFNTFSKAEMDLLLTIQKLNAQTVIVIANDAVNFIREITDLTEKIDRSLEQVATINQAIRIAAAVVVFTGAIASENPVAIAGAIRELVDTLS